MPHVEEALVTVLKAHAGLSALVGTRVFARDDLPQSVVYPAISLSRISTETEHVMGSDPKIDRALFQVDVWDSFTAGRLRSLDAAKQIRAALRDISGTQGGVLLERIFFEGEMDLGSEPEINTRHRALEFEVVFHE